MKKTGRLKSCKMICFSFSKQRLEIDSDLYVSLMFRIKFFLYKIRVLGIGGWKLSVEEVGEGLQ